MKHVEINGKKVDLTAEDCLERFNNGDRVSLYHYYDKNKQFGKVQNLVLLGENAENTYTLSLETGTWNASVVDRSPDLTIIHFFLEE